MVRTWGKGRRGGPHAPEGTRGHQRRSGNAEASSDLTEVLERAGGRGRVAEARAGAVQVRQRDVRLEQAGGGALTRSRTRDSRVGSR